MLIIIVALLFILPVIYKSDIIKLTRTELSKTVNANIDFADMDLSLIRSFPDFNLSVEKLSISGKNQFKEDTLLKLNNLSLALDIFSVFKGENYIIKRITLTDPDVNILVLENGNANYDISFPEDNPPTKSTTTETSSNFSLSINKFRIINGHLKYDNKELDTQLNLKGVNHTLNGNINQDNVILHTSTRVEAVTLIYDGTRYISNIALVYKASISADMKNEIYTMGKNELILNNLFIGFDGSVSYINNDLNLLMTFNSVGNNFKDLFSLVPESYTKDFENVVADGTFSFDGAIKGVYNESTLPSFNINIGVNKGSFQYPGFPKSGRNIELVSNISNKGGSTDNTIVDISRFSILLGDNPISASLKLSTPISDPNIKAKIQGTIDLLGLKDYYPLPENDQMQGQLIMDINLDGKLSSIENERYDDFLAMGSIVAKDINYQTSTLSKPVIIKNTQLNFSPAYLDLVTLNATIGESDFQASGKIENYLAYYLNDEILVGSLKTKSRYVNIDKLISKKDNGSNGETTPANSVSDPEDEAPIKIPENITFTLSSTFDTLIYDNLKMSRVKGNMVIANGTLNIDDLTMNAVGGTMKISGSFSTIDVDNPEAKFNFGMKNMSIPESYNQFALFRNYIPITKNTSGLFSASFGLNTLLDGSLNPVYSSMSGNGLFSTKQISVNGLNSLSQIADALKIEKLNQLEIDDFIAKFKVEEGKLIVKPTKFKYGKINAEIEGWTGLDQSIEYDMNILIPRSELGVSANKVMEDLLTQANSFGTNFSLPENIPVAITIGGTIDNPKVVTKLGKGAKGSPVNIVKETIVKEIGDEASAAAQKILDDADKQAKYLIDEAIKNSALLKKNAAEAVKLLNYETDKQAETLLAEGKKNGFVGEMAAKEAVKHLKNEASDKSDNILAEANKRAGQLIKDAQNASQKIVSEAQKKVDKMK